MQSYELTAKLVRALNILAHPFTAELSDKYGISLNEWRCLRRLAADPGGDSARYLATDTGLDKMSVSRSLTALERKRLIARRRSETDRRVYQIELTTKGKRLREAILPNAIERADEVLRPLSQKQRTALAEALDRIIEGSKDTV